MDDIKIKDLILSGLNKGFTTFEGKKRNDRLQNKRRNFK
jgi:hypothetical protein